MKSKFQSKSNFRIKQNSGLRYGILCLIVCLLAGCDNLLADNTLQPAATPINMRIQTLVPITPTAEETISPEILEATPSPTSTPLPFGLEDAMTVMSGICFESAFDAVDTVFVIRSAEEHIHLYDLAQNSGLCRRPIIRHPFDFSNGRILAGIWTAGIGCTADDEVVDYQRDDAQKTITFQLRFVTAGDCPYELVRPFWVALEGAVEYEVIIHVDRAD